MYKKDKIVYGLIFIATSIVSYCWSIDYGVIASESITIVSIVMAIYMTSFSGLLSSNLAERMKKKEDNELKGKSQLGVLRCYINNAIAMGIVNIIVSCIILILSDKYCTDDIYVIYYVISSLGISTLSSSIYLMYKLYVFMVNRQLWEK